MASADQRHDRSSYAIMPGDYTRLGAQIFEDGTNFALFSAHATRVELCLFEETGQFEIARFDLPEFTNEVWHGFVPGIKSGQLYGYRVHGPFEPEQGHRFTPAKLLLDPYARQLSGALIWDDALYGYDLNGGPDADLVQSHTDSAALMPKSVVSGLTVDGERSRHQLIPWNRSIIYEAHVRGMTMLHPDLAGGNPGTFDAMGSKAMIEHLKAIGVTAVELLPIHAFVNDHHLQSKNLSNYWGYNTIGFFAPHQPYLGADGLASVRNMVRRFHDAGLEVILDVVYNHTAEGNERGATLSFKGIDNASYYRLIPEQQRFYINDTGTGNTVNTSHPRVLQMVLDSLRYWTEAAEIDGFRFDLGSILGREPEGFDPRGGFFDAIGQDPVLSRVKLIGEPWDIGPGGYQVGGFPPGWAEWNDKYRDTVRSFWKGDDGMLRDFAARVTGSGDLYDTRGRRPWSSVNFITAHDGFTLHDVLSYNEKHNEANGEDNKDGHGNNLSFNHGVEGPTEDLDILAIRERQKRNMLATLLLSHGTPMILSGDEIGRTQQGNNNVYAQDNELGWIDWQAAGQPGARLQEFVRRLTRLRAEHAIFRRASFRDGCLVSWLNPGGGEMSPEAWDDAMARTVGLLLERQGKHPPEDGAMHVLMLFNAHDDAVNFILPEHPAGRDWAICLNTEEPEIEADAVPAGETPFLMGPRSMTVFL